MPERTMPEYYISGLARSRSLRQGCEIDQLTVTFLTVPVSPEIVLIRTPFSESEMVESAM